MTQDFGGFDPRMFENVPLFRELAKVMAWQGGPVNWDLARQTAAAVCGADPGAAALPSGQVGFTATSQAGRADTAGDAELAEAVRVAELWLDQGTQLPAVEGRVAALTQAEWVALACTSEGLGVLVEPVAEGMGGALAGQLGQLGLPEGLGSQGGPVGQAIQSMGAMLYGVQIGTVAGHLCGQLLGTYDLALPTVEPHIIGSVGDTAERFATDYGFDATEFRYWLALREAAHRRQFAGVSWLREHVRELIRSFAADADFDAAQLMEQLGGLGLDPSQGLSDPEALRAAFAEPGAFELELTSEQQHTLERLQTLVAFTEAWVDHVVTVVAADKLTALPRFDEAIRRRRAEQGPGERFLQQLIGLDLKPADVRAGQAFCDAVVAARGQEGLDRAWGDPAYLPRPDEIADPSRWLVRMAGVEIEAELGDDPHP